MVKKKGVLYHFFMGIVKGVGFAFGASLVFALLLWLLSKLSIIPLLGEWIIKLIDYIRQTRVY